MRISELARSSGLPVATIKFYLREGVLPPGRSTSATQADYDDAHLARLRLVRALVEVGGLPLAAVRDVLAAMDAPHGVPAAVSAAHDALAPKVPPAQGTARARAAVDHLGWDVAEGSAALGQLDVALAALEVVGLPAGPERLLAYGDAALTAARVDVAGVPRSSAEDAVRTVVAGTILYEPVLLALRRLAQQHVFRSGATQA